MLEYMWLVVLLLFLYEGGWRHHLPACRAVTETPPGEGQESSGASRCPTLLFPPVGGSWPFVLGCTSHHYCFWNTTSCTSSFPWAALPKLPGRHGWTPAMYQPTTEVILPLDPFPGSSYCPSLILLLYSSYSLHFPSDLLTLLISLFHLLQECRLSSPGLKWSLNSLQLHFLSFFCLFVCFHKKPPKHSIRKLIFLLSFFWVERKAMWFINCTTSFIFPCIANSLGKNCLCFLCSVS